MYNQNSKHRLSSTAMRSTRHRYLTTSAICLAVLMTTNAAVVAQYNGSFVDVQPVPGLEHPSSWNFMSDISDDGLTIAMSSTRSGALNGRNYELYEATRDSVLDPFGEPVRQSSLNRSGVQDFYQTVSSDGLTTYFSSNPPVGSQSPVATWTATRTTRESDWDEPTFLHIDNAIATDAARLSSDDLTLYFSGVFNDGGPQLDLFKMERTSPSEPFGNPEPLTNLNTPSKHEGNTAFSSDGLAVFFNSATLEFRDARTMIATRPSKDEPFEAPVNVDNFGLGSELHSQFNDLTAPVISSDWPADGSKLYFSANKSHGGISTIYEATWNVYAEGDTNLDNDVDSADRTTVVSNWTGALEEGGSKTWEEGDFDADGDVDSADQTSLVTNWTGAMMATASENGEPAELIYDPATGNVKLDASRTDTGSIVSFVLGTEDATFIADEAMLPFADIGANTDATAFQIGQTDALNQGAGPIVDLGNIFPTGIADASELSDYLSLAEYASDLGSGGTLQLSVVPEPSSITLLMLGIASIARRRKRQPRDRAS